MNVERNSPVDSSVVGEVSTPGPFARWRLWKWASVPAFVTKNLVLDIIERAVVLILFLYFANRMLPQLARLITTEIAHPELFWLAASKNFDATLLVISE